MSCVRRVASVRMFTTIGVAVFAMLRNVVASIGPPRGAEFIGGGVIVCAPETGARSRREARTIPTASEAAAISTE